MIANRRRILVIMATAQKARRDKLAGIYDSAHAKGWMVSCIVDPTQTASISDAIKGIRPDGIISDGFNPPARITPAIRNRIPIVYIDKPTLDKDGDFSVNHDNAATARLAAATLMKLGFSRLAAVGMAPNPYWSRIRIRTFAEEAKANAMSCSVYCPSGDGLSEDAELRKWLSGLPRPCGIFAVTDARAKAVIENCVLLGISVPDEIAVIGVDDDELVCENTTPSISSILPDFRLAGRLAAERLERLMDGRKPDGIPRSYGPKAIIRRASTRRISISDGKIASILEYIRVNATSGIRIADVVNFAGMPKSTLELHFRLATSRSIMQEMQEVRLRAVRHLLRETRTPISLIAQRCGYRNDNHLKNLFKRKFGMSLSAYRNADGQR